MEPVDEVRVIFDRGLEGCIHGRLGSNRQVLLMDVETLEKLGIPPGSVKENITTRGLDVRGLAPGAKLRIGDAQFEVLAPCHPCSRMDEIRAGLQELLRGQRGLLCRVVGAGWIRRGDEIEIISEPVRATA